MWSEDVHGGAIEAYVGMILMSTSELRSLELPLEYCSKQHLDSLFQTITTSPPRRSLSSLSNPDGNHFLRQTSVRLESSDEIDLQTSTASAFEHLAGICYLPNLEDLTIELPREPGGFSRPPDEGRLPLQDLKSFYQIEAPQRQH